LTSLKSTSRRQVRKGDRPCEGSPSANLRANEQKLDIRPNPRASQHNMTKPTGSLGDGKFSGCAVKDHVLTRGDLPDLRSQ